MAAIFIGGNAFSQVTQNLLLSLAVELAQIFGTRYWMAARKAE